MTIQNILSMLVLSLCLSTLFITLLTFILYKAKQILKLKQDKGFVHTDGVYFKKYAPFLKINAEITTQNLTTFKTSFLKFFGFLSLILFLSFISSDYIFIHNQEDESKVNPQQFASLVAKGLLNEFDFNPLIENSLLNSFLFPNAKKITNDIFLAIQNKKIGLFKSKELNKHNIYHLDSVISWEKYLTQNNINFQEISNFDEGKNFDIVILPQIKSLKKGEEDQILNLRLSGINILATGPIGYLNEEGLINHSGVIEKLFNVTFHQNINPKILFPSQFASASQLKLDILPGSLINWFPVDNTIQATPKNNDTSIYESNYQGQSLYIDKLKISRAQFTVFNNSRQAWVALDPPDLSQYSENEINEVNNFYARVFQWELGMPSAFVHFWKSGADSVFVSSVDVSDDLNKVTELKSQFKNREYPATFFVLSHLLKRKQAFIQKTFDENYELSAFEENNDNFEGKSSEAQFKYLQDIRFMNEKISENKLLGFHTPEDKMNKSIVNAVFQNRLTYIFGKTQLNGFGPLLLDSENFIFFPKVFSNDLDVLKKEKLYNSILQQESLLNDYKQVLEFKGAYYFNINTQGFGDVKKFNILNEFLDKVSATKPWKTNFSTLANWWMQRAKIHVNFINDVKSGKIILEIKNDNKTMANDVMISLNTAGKKYNFFTYNDKIQVIKPNENGYTIILLKNILPNDTMHISERK